MLSKKYLLLSLVTILIMISTLVIYGIKQGELNMERYKQGGLFQKQENWQ